MSDLLRMRGDAHVKANMRISDMRIYQMIDDLDENDREEIFVEELMKLFAQDCSDLCGCIEDRYLEDDTIPNNVDVAVGAAVCSTEILWRYGLLDKDE